MEADGESSPDSKAKWGALGPRSSHCGGLVALMGVLFQSRGDSQGLTSCRACRAVPTKPETPEQAIQSGNGHHDGWMLELLWGGCAPMAHM